MSFCNSRFAFLALVSAIPMFQGCATILSESRYPVTVDNAGASTYFMVHDKHSNLVHSGVTPQQVTLDAKSNIFMPAKYKVTYAGEGDASQTRELNASVDPWIAGNLVFGGIPGLAVDGVTGAMWKLPKRIEGNVPPQFAINDREHGEMLARSETQRQASPASTQQNVRQAAASSSESNSLFNR